MIPSPQVSFGKYGNTGMLDPNSFSRTGTVYSGDTDSFQILLQQNINNAFNILFDDNNDNNSDTTFSSIFPNQTTTSSLFGGSLDTGDITTNISGQSSLFSEVNPALEMIARSNLIGKNVEAFDTATNQTFTGIVKSVQLEGGVLLIEVGDKKVPPEYLIKISE